MSFLKTIEYLIPVPYNHAFIANRVNSAGNASNLLIFFTFLLFFHKFGITHFFLFSASAGQKKKSNVIIILWVLVY